ncbi:MAG: sigma-70 family RNA polymerase sigma factor [Deltaproteobacteria bacterium]|nr:sigma-70 family RNA polymerase sigma factor [Deltaproteobacteria bacterium]
MAQARLAEVYRQCAPLIYRRSLRLLGSQDEALDAVQDIFERLQGTLATFRGEAELMTWIYRVTTNHCLNQLRARRVRSRAHERLGTEAPRDGGEGGARAVEARDLLVQLLERCDARLVQIAYHYYVDEMTQPEIAEVVGISDRGVRKALSRFAERAGRELPRLERARGGL